VSVFNSSILQFFCDGVKGKERRRRDSPRRYLRTLQVRNRRIFPSKATVGPSQCSGDSDLRSQSLRRICQFLPSEDEGVENTVDFHSVGYHRIYINAVVTLVKIAAGKVVLKIRFVEISSV
jgi:hypothetical protein